MVSVRMRRGEERRGEEGGSEKRGREARRKGEGQEDQDGQIDEKSDWREGRNLLSSHVHVCIVRGWG